MTCTKLKEMGFSILYDEYILRIIIDYNHHEEIKIWVQVCKKMNQVIKNQWPSFFQMDKHKNLNSNFLQFCSKGNLNGVQYFLSKHTLLDKSLGLKYASQNGHLKIVKILTNQNVSFDFGFDFWKNLVCKGHINVLDHFISRRVDDFFQLNNLAFYAVQTGNLEMVRYLISKGADPFVYNHLLFQNACLCGHLKLVEFFISLGSDIHANNDCALYFACEGGNLDIVRFLVSLGANINLSQGLNGAAYKNHWDIIYYLNSHKGIELSNSAIQTAFIAGNVKMATFLFYQQIKNKILQSICKFNHFILSIFSSKN